jgi:small subunit ribosomal protein S2
MTLSKKERLQVDRLRAKLDKNLGSIADMSRIPAALFVVDIKAEHIAVKEAKKLNIPVFAMVDTNSDPRLVEYVIPANDDASKSIDKILSLVTASITEGLSERKSDKEETEAEAAPVAEEAAPVAENQAEETSTEA